MDLGGKKEMPRQKIPAIEPAEKPTKRAFDSSLSSLADALRFEPFQVPRLDPPHGACYRCKVMLALLRPQGGGPRCRGA